MESICLPRDSLRFLSAIGLYLFHLHPPLTEVQEPFLQDASKARMDQENSQDEIVIEIDVAIFSHRIKQSSNDVVSSLNRSIER